MVNAHLVFITADHDCDGVFYAAHRVSVPAHRAVELRNVSALETFLSGSDIKYSGYVRDAIDVVTVPDFFAQYRLDEWDREYFQTEGYSSLRDYARLAPWVRDDTIGIPALDTRYEDDFYQDVVNY